LVVDCQTVDLVLEEVVHDPKQLLGIFAFLEQEEIVCDEYMFVDTIWILGIDTCPELVGILFNA
jgi:hypothetical protein